MKRRGGFRAEGGGVVLLFGTVIYLVVSRTQRNSAVWMWRLPELC